MHVTVNYLAQVKRAAGVSGERVAIPANCTLAQLILQLACQHEAAFRAMVLDFTGQPQTALLYAVGDSQADLSHALSDGDVVTILAPMAGG